MGTNNYAHCLKMLIQTDTSTHTCMLSDIRTHNNVCKQAWEQTVRMTWADPVPGEPLHMWTGMRQCMKRTTTETPPHIIAAVQSLVKM